MAEEQLNGWTEWGHYVLKTLEKLENKLNCIERKRNSCELQCREEITKLKVKATIWGSISGAVVSLIASFIIMLSVHIIKDRISNKDTSRKPSVEKRLDKEDVEKMIEKYYRRKE